MTKLYAEFVGPTPDEVKRQKTLQRQMFRLEHLRRRRVMPHQLYSILPWSLEELPGTSWRNAHTAKVVSVQRLGENRWGEIGPDPWASGGMFSIGLWRDGQFCIEHWVRVDHLPAEMQIEWAKEHVAHCRTGMLREQKKIDKAKKRGATRKNYSVGWSVAALEQARRELIALCEEFGAGDVDVLNVGIQSDEQMRMF